MFLQSNWEHHKEVKAAQGVKIIAKELEKSLAGLPMYVAKRDDEVEYYKVQRKLFGFNVIGFRFLKRSGNIYPVTHSVLWLSVKMYVSG